jgi:flagellar hook-basal body complex protein FliE
MTAGINGISTTSLTSPGNLMPRADDADGSFKNFLVDAIQEVNTMQQDADRAVESLMTGEDVNPAEVLTAVQKADVAFRMMLQVRNKMVAAFNEVQSIRI